MFTPGLLSFELGARADVNVETSGAGTVRATTVSQTVALFVEAEPNGFADRQAGDSRIGINRDKAFAWVKNSKSSLTPRRLWI